MKEPKEPNSSAKDQAVEQAKEFINKYRKDNKSFNDVNPEVLLHLAALKRITSNPKQDKPDNSFQEINKYLGEAESNETLRQERWHAAVRCPQCNSNKIKRLAAVEQKSKYNYKYQCLDCNHTFSDDGGSTIETDVPPLRSWMFCWYLLGCTNSLQYIANKLGLSISLIEMMVHHMQKLFQSEQPLTHMLSFEEWAAQHGIKYQPVIEAAIAKQTELHRGEVSPTAFLTSTPRDTREYRKVKDRAQGIGPDGKPKKPPRPY